MGGGLHGGVSVCLGGVCLPRGCLPREGVCPWGCLPRGWVSQHAMGQTPFCEQNDRCKNITLL